MDKVKANKQGSKTIGEIEIELVFIRLRYYRQLVTAMQCADMGVVNQKTYDYVIARIEELQDQIGNYWDKMELIG